MYISHAQIKNYKSFLDSQVISLDKGFNVVIGQNNAGKTALMESLSLNTNNAPHISPITAPVPGTHPDNSSQVILAFTLEISELKSYLKEHFPTFNIRRQDEINPELQIKNIIDSFNNPEVQIRAVFDPSNLSHSELIGIDGSGSSRSAIQFNIGPETGEIEVNHQNVGVGDDKLVSFLISQILARRIYYFHAERFNVGQHQIRANDKLEGDASNLAEVLHYLQTSNPPRFERFEEYIRIIFPDILQITIPPTVRDPNMAEIFLWHIEPSSERSDLAISLKDSGTGIGQVLSILYVALNSQTPSTLLIDEPQSFLHPSAVRKLFEILNSEFSQHQYIVTTHSPSIISVSRPFSIILLRKVDYVSTATALDPYQSNDLRLVLAEVGARLSDVFGMDNIIWVEGRTEEVCFPLIVSGLLERPLLGSNILGVLNVGDLEGRHSKDVLRIYQRLSTGHTVIPPALGFIFDQENRTDVQKEDLIRESKGLIHFLGRRMYENYLLNPIAIASLFESLEDFSDVEITNQNIQSWIAENGSKIEYISEDLSDSQFGEKNWMSNVHGSKLLNDLIKSFSDNRYQYDKVNHAYYLTKWIIINSPSDLVEVAELINEVLGNES